MKHSLSQVTREKDEQAVKIRQEYIEHELNTDLSATKKHALLVDAVSKKNCENLIGATQVPLGIAGPLRITLASDVQEEVYIPLATTEGALVASTSRGCSLSRELPSGFSTIVTDKKMTRAPLFRVPSARVGKKVSEWIANNINAIKDEVAKEDRFCSLLGIRTWIVGRNLFCRCSFDTFDAMGMNMATFASARIAETITKQFPEVQLVALSGNMCIDKKPSALGLIEGRGVSVVAEAILPKELVAKKLHCTPEDFVEVVQRKIFVGSGLAGSYGFNAHVANIAAALFIATGQDPAHVVEASQAITTAEILPDGSLYVSLTMPNLNCATFGGGTDGATQKEALAIMEVTNTLAPGENAKRYAQIVAAAALAGELSLLGALTEGTLAKAHKDLGRISK